MHSEKYLNIELTNCCVRKLKPSMIRIDIRKEFNVHCFSFCVQWKVFVDTSTTCIFIDPAIIPFLKEKHTKQMKTNNKNHESFNQR